MWQLVFSSLGWHIFSSGTGPHSKSGVVLGYEQDAPLEQSVKKSKQTTSKVTNSCIN